MSYFCANSISIRKQNKTCKVKGGDNNVTPRSNYWSNYFPIVELIRDVQGGMVQFTSRKPKNIAIEQLCFDYAEKIRKLTGIDIYYSYDLDELMESDISKVEKSHFMYETNKKILEFIREGDMPELTRLKEEFVEKVANLKVDTRKLWILRRKKGGYINKIRKGSYLWSYYLYSAKKLCRIKAEESLKRLGKDIVEIVKYEERKA